MHGEKRLYIVFGYIELQVFETIRVEVIGQDTATFLGCGKGKWTNARKDVRNNVFRREHVDEPRMFRVQPRIPVHFPEVEGEFAIRLRL